MVPFKQFLDEEYVKDTKKYIAKLIKKADDDQKKFLEGLKKFLDENGFLTDEQKKALGNMTRELK